ncbi:MAG: type IV pilus secretin PilQ [candidate division Zixibacteria bacterium]|nr:type IV pilus secretin PilQ [candidate division Zixibacteria bacterium]
MRFKILISATSTVLVVALVFFSLAPAVVSQSGVSNPNKPIETLNFQNAEVTSVLNFLADYGQVNLVTAPQVEGNVTLSLKNVSWQQALDILTKTYNLTAVKEKGYIRVLPTEDWMKESKSEQMHASEQNAIVPLESRIIDVDNAQAADLVIPVKSLLSARGGVEIDARTNSLIVQDIPSNLSKVEAFVKELDCETAQIKISTQLVEVSSTALEEIGVNWDILTSETMADGTQYDSETRVLGADKVLDPIVDFTFGTVQKGWNLQTKIAALISDGRGKILAHPEITTVDNKEARIQMGQKIPIKQFDGSGNVVITYEEVGTILRVTPHITSENRILMHLMPERSTYEFDPNGLIINTNNAETNVVVENGQTVVIGGLTTQDLIENESGVPVLKDIPIIGYLFKYTKKRIENRDLVIFVTPTVVESSLASNGG